MGLSATESGITNITKRHEKGEKKSSWQAVSTVTTNGKESRKTALVFQWPTPWFITPFILRCNLTQIALQLDALYSVTWRESRGNLTQIAKLGNASWPACCFFFRNNLIIIVLKRSWGGSAFGRKRGWFCGQSWLRMRHENTSGSVGYSSRKGQHASVIGASSRSFPCSCTPWDLLPTSS